MSLYSYQGQDPKELPFRIRLDDGSTRTSLNELSTEELKNLGFIGPFTKPEFDENLQRIEWNGNEYKIIPLTEEEIIEKISDREAKERKQKLKNIDFNIFWEKFINSLIYKKLRIASSQSLTANILCTELIAIFGDAKAGKINDGIIQKYINILFLNFDFSGEEIEELQKIMKETNLNIRYTIPDTEYFSHYTYDSESNTIISPSPFGSWILVNGKWNPPIPYPTDGKVYSWNEEIENWEET